MPVFTVTCVLLAAGGVFKLRAPRAARESLANAGIRAPASAVRMLGALEIALGIAAAIWPRPLLAGLVAFAYGGFCVFGVRLWVLGRDQDCGCFGEAGAGVGPTHLILNGIACATALLAALTHPPGPGSIVARAPLESVIAGVGIAAASFAVYAVFTLFPAAWRSYGAS